MTDKQKIAKMIEDDRKNSGEYTFKTVKGKVQDVHRVKPNE